LLQLKLFFSLPVNATTIWLLLRRISFCVRIAYHFLTAKGTKDTQRIAKTLRLFANFLAFFAVRPFFNLVLNPDSYRDSEWHNQRW